LDVLEGAPVSRIALISLPVLDLRPLKDAPLRSLNVMNCPVEDLSSLKGMQLEELYLEATRVRDLKPLAGMNLKRLCLDKTSVSDLSPLKDMKLEQLWAGTTRISNLHPLRGMPLRLLHIDGCPVLEDVSPLLDLPLLEQVWLPSTAKNAHLLRSHPRLKYISYQFDSDLQRPQHTKEEFFSIAQPDTESNLARDQKFTDLEKLLSSRVKSNRTAEASRDYYQLAVVRLALGDYWGYRRLCSQIYRSFGGQFIPKTTFSVALAPELGAAKDELAYLLKVLQEERNDDVVSVTLASALGQFRLGNLDSAEQVLAPFRKPEWPGGWPKNCSLDATAAMIRINRGDLSRAREVLTRDRSVLDSQRNVAHGDEWPDWLVAEILTREAEAVLANAERGRVKDLSR
jgi:Leucine-rich repeat (LRR) protein